MSDIQEKGQRLNITKYTDPNSSCLTSLFLKSIYKNLVGIANFVKLINTNLLNNTYKL